MLKSLKSIENVETKISSNICKYWTKVYIKFFAVIWVLKTSKLSSFQIFAVSWMSKHFCWNICNQLSVGNVEIEKCWNICNHSSVCLNFCGHLDVENFEIKLFQILLSIECRNFKTKFLLECLLSLECLKLILFLNIYRTMSVENVKTKILFRHLVSIERWKYQNWIFVKLFGIVWVSIMSKISYFSNLVSSVNNV